MARKREKRDNAINFTLEGGTIMYVLSFLNRHESINEIDNKPLLNQNKIVLIVFFLLCEKCFNKKLVRARGFIGSQENCL